LALSVVFSLFASYFVAMSVVPLFCAKLIKAPHSHDPSHVPRGFGQKFNHWFNGRFNAMVAGYDRLLSRSLARPFATVIGLTGVFLLSLGLAPFIGVSYFPRTDPGQFVINLKAPTGTRIEYTEYLVKAVENIIREEVPQQELRVVVSNV